MYLLFRWLLVIACVIVGGFSVGFTVKFVISQFGSKEISKIEPSDPRYREVMCGPESLSIALGRLGIVYSPTSVASRCRVTPKGVALSGLERVANGIHRIEANAKKLQWDDLCRLDGVAVLFVKGNHYFAVDPRERQPEDTATEAMVRIYDPQSPARWWTREDLEKIWTGGDALVLTKHTSPADQPEDGAVIEWDTSFIDKGVLQNTPLVSYQFSLRNVGNEDLIIGDIHKSCGCQEHSLSQDRLAPGESAILTIDVNLAQFEGYIQQNVLVESNDAKNPMSFLLMAAGVPRQRFISSDVIRLEDLPQGGKVSQEFYVVDPGFGGVKIRETRFVMNNHPEMEYHLSCLISPDLIGQRRVGFRTKPDDYVVQLSFEASKTCPIGNFQGEVVVVLESDNGITTHKVQINGTVVQDVHPIPRIALITLDEEGNGSVSFKLQSHLKQDFRIIKFWSDSEDLLKVAPCKDVHIDSNIYTVSAHNLDLIAGTPPLQQVVFFELDSGIVISVPVAIFKVPQQEH